MIDDVVKNIDEKFNGPVETLINELDSIRAGRASTRSVENIVIDYYGTKSPIKSLANITLSGPRSIQITPYDKSQITSIEKGLTENQSVDGNISSDGNSIFINLPELTTEKRHDYVKMARVKAEETKVATRAIRHNAYKEIDDFKDTVSEDDIRNAKEQIDKKINIVTERIDQLFKEKESQILG